MLRVIAAIAALEALMLGPAWSCDGQPGKVIFEDTFPDDSGGWEFTPPLATVKPPAFVFALDASHINVASQNLTFHATEADFCLETMLPKAPAADNNPYVGIEFWATDYNNLMLLELSGDGTVALFSKSGNWQTLFSVEKAPGFKSEPGAVNALRVNTIGGKITAYLNGTQVKVIRAQIPNGPRRFGIYTQYDKMQANNPPIKVTSYKVTAGQ